MRRYILWLMILAISLTLVLGSLFSSCKMEETTKETTEEFKESAEEVEQINLVMWWWGEQDLPGLKDFINNVILDYEELNPNVTIEAVLQGTDETIPAFKAAAQAREVPDIATLWFGLYMYEDLWAGNIAPISDYISNEETKHWIERDFASYDDKIWGVGIYTGALVMGYNKELFSQAGLDPEKPPSTWDEFISACEKLKDSGITPVGLGLSDGWTGVVLPNFFTFQLADSTVVKNAVKGERSFEEPEFTDVFARLRELVDKEFLNKNAASIGYFDSQQELYQGNVAMGFMFNTTLLDANREMETDKFAIMPAPQISKDPIEFLPTTGCLLFITEWSSNKQAAADFLAYLHDQKVQQSLYDTFEGAVMPFDRRFDFNQVQDPMLKDMYDRMINGFDNNLFSFEYYLPWTILEAYMSQSQLIMSTDFDPSEAGKEIEKAASQWREQNPEILEYYKKW